MELELPSHKFPLKTIVLVIVLLGVFSALLFFYKSSFHQKTAPTKEKTNQVKPTAKQTGNLFVADLEYDPTTGIVTQHDIQRVQGTPAIFSTKQPVNASSDFIYRVAVVSKNQLVTEGWESIAKDIIKTAKNTLRFTIAVPYSQNAIVRVYTTDNKILWTGKMQ